MRKPLKSRGGKRSAAGASRNIEPNKNPLVPRIGTVVIKKSGAHKIRAIDRYKKLIAIKVIRSDSLDWFS